ncbi:MAG TPA: type II toxin-antitoxin system HicB family antitoxin [Thermoplasmata archaeon]|nr:type II toxin-antitoxin system HicB family antitoxin [Thermoplasmata archaeon]
MKLKVVIEPDPEDGGYVASCPALPGCHSQGETIAEARRNIRDAIRLCLDVLNERAKATSRKARLIEVDV